MEKSELVSFLNELFIPLGYKWKGNNWVQNGEILTKMVNLQKSNYANYFYINYGFIIRKLKLTTQMHVWHRLHGNSKEETLRVEDLLNMESTINEAERLSELRHIVTHQIINKLQSVNNEEELLDEIMKMPTLNIIPLVVKEHFQLLD